MYTHVCEIIVYSIPAIERDIDIYVTVHADFVAGTFL